MVTVSSTMHRIGRIRFDDLHGAHRYRKWRAYGQSKLSNLLFFPVDDPGASDDLALAFYLQALVSF